ncbi:MAG: hypothetical protein ACK56I_13160, partial [bacterium]
VGGTTAPFRLGFVSNFAFCIIDCVLGMLQPRDLRVIDPFFSASKYPAFLVRHACIIVNLEPVRAIIVPGKVFFFPEEGADSEISVSTSRSLTVCLGSFANYAESFER